MYEDLDFLGKFGEKWKVTPQITAKVPLNVEDNRNNKKYIIKWHLNQKTNIYCFFSAADIVLQNSEYNLIKKKKNVIQPNISYKYQIEAVLA